MPVERRDRDARIEPLKRAIELWPGLMERGPTSADYSVTLEPDAERALGHLGA